MKNTTHLVASLTLLGCGAVVAQENGAASPQLTRLDLAGTAGCRAGSPRIRGGPGVVLSNLAAGIGRDEPFDEDESCTPVLPGWNKITGPNDTGYTDWWSYPGSSYASYGVGASSLFTFPNPGATGQYPDADQSGACYLTWRPGYNDSVLFDGLNPGTAPLSVFAWNGSGWVQQTGVIQRNAAIMQRSVFLTNVGGLSFTASFSGGNTTSYNGQATVQDAVYFASQRCLTAGTEFGFFRQINGSSYDKSLFFYWGLNENCPSQSTHTWYCATSTDGGRTYTEIRTQTTYGIFQIPIPSLGQAWRYYVWLSHGAGGYVWNFRVTDPSGTTLEPCDTSGHTSGCTMSATPGGTSDPFNSFAAAMLDTATNGALGGYIVVGSLNAQSDTYYSGSDSPTMIIGDVWAPAYSTRRGRL